MADDRGAEDHVDDGRENRELQVGIGTELPEQGQGHAHADHGGVGRGLHQVEEVGQDHHHHGNGTKAADGINGAGQDGGRADQKGDFHKVLLLPFLRIIYYTAVLFVCQER